MQYGLIGCPVGHSFSKEIHGLLGRYPYSLLEVAPLALERFLRERDFRGVNVTLPHKRAVIPYLDELSVRARQIGAVNTIVNRAGRLYGENTDFDGMRAALLHADIDPAGKKVLILGTGGTSRTALAVAKSLGARAVYRVSRTGAADALTYRDAERQHADAEVLLNTTPCGMTPNTEASPIALASFSALKGVFDAIYTPLRTSLVLDAERRGIKAAGGLYMLVMQAVRAAELFTGDPIAEEEARRVYQSVLRARQNLVLIGMPGVGKTRVGERLAERLSRPFFDADREIVRKIGMPIPVFFERYGEEAFRAVESEVLAALSEKTGIVLATGGGAILKEQNVRALKRNGSLLFLDRPIEQIRPTPDRPLSSDRAALNALYRERIAKYRAAADRHIRSGRHADETAQRILEETT